MVLCRYLKRRDEFPNEAYERLFAQMPQFTMRGERLVEYIDKKLRYGRILILEESDWLLGVLGFYANDNVRCCTFLSCIVVDVSLRGQGWAKCLVSRWFASAESSGMVLFNLHVLCGNTPAIAFYRKFGAVILGPSLQGPGRWHMMGRLP